MRTALLFVRSILPLAVVSLATPIAAAQKTKTEKPPTAAAASQQKTEASAGQADARKLGEAFAATADKLGPSVVQIDVTTRDEQATAMGWFHGRGPNEVVIQRGMGSGVVFSADGAIVTNNHVVEQALTINVRTQDGRILTARLVGRDPATDLAVLRVDAKDLVPARFADSDATRVGEWVVAIGSPFGLGRTVTAGVVSAKGRGSLGVSAVEDYLQTDASINPGNSGGPLSNLDGEVLGINTMIVGRGAGIGFAVPSNMARRVATQILAKGKVERAFVGVGVQDVTPALAEELHATAGAGALLNAVAADGPGAKGNLKPGDVVTSVNGKTIFGAQEFVRAVLTQDAGATLSLEVIRGGKRYATQLTLAPRTESAPPPVPAQIATPPGQGTGLGLRDVTAEAAAAAGLPPVPLCQIASVALGSSADRAGLRAGDVIVEADGRSDPTAAMVQQAAQDGHVLLRVRRRDGAFYAAVKQ
jgi:serine protease Do